MSTKTIKDDKARFDTRLPKEQKLFFERAATLGGFRSLTDFVLLAAQEKAKMIFRERDRILASQKDNEFFFDAIINAEKPNDNLKAAFNKYKELSTE